jgi:hypothetical protein
LELHEYDEGRELDSVEQENFPWELLGLITLLDKHQKRLFCFAG